MKGMIIVVSLLLLLLVAGFIITSFPMPWNAKLDFQATVTEIELKQGGWNSAAIAQITFDNGKVLPFPETDADRFTINHTYRLQLQEYNELWNIRQLEETDGR